MPGLELLAPFFAATLVFACMPGPAILYTAAQTFARGRSGGLWAALGIHCGGYVHVLSAALGLSVLQKLVPELYLGLKLAGALYLMWLGIRIIARRTDWTALPELRGRGAARAFVESVLVEVLNPKAALFFLAFLPQFVDPAAALPAWAQFLILGTIVNLAFSSADLATVLLASAMVSRLRRSGRIERLTRWLGGSLLVGLGASLAASRS